MFIDCLFGRHRPDRRRVYYDGDVFRGVCKHCGARIVRLESGWAPERRYPPGETPDERPPPVDVSSLQDE
jgi:hypothetical protein